MEEGMRYEKLEVRVNDGLRAPYRKRRRVPQFLFLHSACFYLHDSAAHVPPAWPCFVLSMLRRLFPRWDTHIAREGGQ